MIKIEVNGAMVKQTISGTGQEIQSDLIMATLAITQVMCKTKEEAQTQLDTLYITATRTLNDVTDKEWSTGEVENDNK